MATEHCTTSSTSNRIPTLFESAMANEPIYAPRPSGDFLDYKNRISNPEFKKLPRDEQSKQRGDFCRREDISEYLESKWKAELHNRDNFLMIYQFVKDDRDNERQTEGSVLRKLTKFKKVIKSQQFPFEALAMDFSKYPFPELE